jgi:outer membrane protein assembly factor BamB
MLNAVAHRSLGPLLFGLVLGCADPGPEVRVPRAEATAAVSIESATVAAPQPPAKTAQAKDPAKPRVLRDFAPANIAVESNLAALPVSPFGKASAQAPLKLKWATQVGLLTFRSTMFMSGGKLVVGTHGSSLSAANESKDGVYVLEASSGKVERIIATPGKGDLDVGGVAFDQGVVYFTSDSGLVTAATLDGTIVWKTALEGKVRPAPALARTRSASELEVVVGDEQGHLVSLDAKTGSKLWSIDTGENDYGARGFIAAAAIVDVDGDGHDDIVAGARDGVLAAYRGVDGKPFWRASGGSGIHASPSVIDVNGDGKLEILAGWSYSVLGVFDVARGKQNWGASLSLPSGGIEGLFSSPVPVPGASKGAGFIAIGSSWWDKEDGVTMLSGTRASRSQEGRTTSSAVVTDLDNDGALDAIMVSEAGAVLQFSSKLERRELARVPAKAEATPMLADVDQNGTFELLVVGGDGKLRCFETGSKEAPKVSRFRGESTHNRGDLTHLVL